METCLQPLWDVLRNENILDLDWNTDDIKEYINKIELFFKILQNNLGQKQKSIKKPLHIEEYIKLLERGHQQEFKKNIQYVQRQTDSCNLCAVCRGCSKKFYNDIQKGKMTEKSLPYELENYFLKKPQMYYYQESRGEKKERTYLKNRFILLKGFSSSTPVIYSASFDIECNGGGFYFNYKGTGIVVDPGIGFVKSMHKYGIFIDDVDVVVITHDHLDHNADAETLSSLVHDFNNFNQRMPHVMHDVFGTMRSSEHEILWITDENTKNKLQGKVEKLKSLDDYTRYCRKEIIPKEKGIFLSAIRTKHIKDSEESYGIKLFAEYEKDYIISYTSDTAYFEELSHFFADQDILVFNVSDIYKKDVKGIRSKNSHLGYNGSIELLKNTNYRIGVASEFCCTNGDFRINFIKAVKREIEKEKRSCILPGEMGFNIYLPELQSECAVCKGRTDIDKLYVISPSKEYGRIQYICRHCALGVI